jgi:hypothetical protein
MTQASGNPVIRSTINVRTINTVISWILTIQFR